MEDGVWRTIRGRRIFIRDGESLGSAMSRSGKFNRSDIREGKKDEILSSGLRKKLKNDNKYGDKKDYKIDRKISNKIEKRYPSIVKDNQAEKNRINENAHIEGSGQTRVQRNWNKYSERDRRELRHEELKRQLENYKKIKYDYSLADKSLKDVEKAKKELADFKAKKQSNNKVELSKKQIEAGNRLNANAENGARSDINTWLDSDEKDYGSFIKDLANEWNIDKDRAEKLFYEELDKKQKYEDSFKPSKEDLDDINHWYNDDPREEWNKQETIKNYVEKKKSNNNVKSSIPNSTINHIKTQKQLKELVNDGLVKDITNNSWEANEKLRKKTGKLEKVKTTSGTYGLNGALLKDSKGNYYVITARNTNIDYWL